MLHKKEKNSEKHKSAQHFAGRHSQKVDNSPLNGFVVNHSSIYDYLMALKLKNIELRKGNVIMFLTDCYLGKYHMNYM